MSEKKEYVLITGASSGIGRQIAITLSERTRSEVVQVIGRKIVLYKRNMEDPGIIFPGEKIKKDKNTGRR